MAQLSFKYLAMSSVSGANLIHPCDLNVATNTSWSNQWWKCK